MSVDTLTSPRLADDDGSGKDSDWRNWGASMDGAEESPAQTYVMRDVGGRVFTGRTAMAGFTEDFHTDRVMPARPSARFVTQLHLGSENYIG
jgi:hypothetical protein